MKSQACRPIVAFSACTLVLAIAFAAAMQTMAGPAGSDKSSKLTPLPRPLDVQISQARAARQFGGDDLLTSDLGSNGSHLFSLAANPAAAQGNNLQYDNPDEGKDSSSAGGAAASQKSSKAGLLLAATTSIGSTPIPLNSHTIVDIAEAAAPSVVNIEVVRHDDRTSLLPFSIDPSNPLNGQLFLYNGRKLYPFNDRLVPMPKPAPGSKKPDAVGSGMVIREDGFILTNAHVVKGASEIRVNLNDKRSFPGTIVGTDSFSDLAVVKINARGLPSIKLGSSANLRPGEFVVAIGDPLSFDHTVTFGIISAVGRTITDVNGNINFIQTDTAINPGNSGGPLLNLKGEVIAINTAIDKVGQNIGFSIPVDVAKNVAEDLIHNRPISRPWIGIGVRPLTEAKYKALGLKPDQPGVSVELVYETSPAQEAGIEPGDVLLKIDGKPVSEGKSVQDIVRAHKVKDTLSVTYWRGGEEKTTEMTIGEFPELGEAPKAEKIPPNAAPNTAPDISPKNPAKTLKDHRHEK